MDLPDELRRLAAGPMCRNPEHTKLCNMLTEAADELERLDGELAALHAELAGPDY